MSVSIKNILFSHYVKGVIHQRQQPLIIGWHNRPSKGFGQPHHTISISIRLFIVTWVFLGVVAAKMTAWWKAWVGSKSSGHHPQWERGECSTVTTHIVICFFTPRIKDDHPYATVIISQLKCLTWGPGTIKVRK